MPQSIPPENLTDYLTSRPIPHVGAEANRQAVIRYLIDEAGYEREEIEADIPISVSIDGAAYDSKVDLVISREGVPLMLIKCAAGSLGSREREALAAARLLKIAPLPLTLVSDGKQAVLLATTTGRRIAASDLSAIPPRNEIQAMATAHPTVPLTISQRHRESLVFRSYDSMNVNVAEG